jgi:hypothetical protein
MEWQPSQLRGVPLNTPCTWQYSQARSRCAPCSSYPVVRWSKPVRCTAQAREPGYNRTRQVRMRPATDTARLCSRRFPTSVVGPWPLEGRGGVTELTLCAEPAAVNVVFRVTPAAQHRGLDDVLRFQVALGATDLRMGAAQRKPGARRMVEIPQFPAIRRVARGAGLGQCAVMGVISRVAVIAVR